MTNTKKTPPLTLWLLAALALSLLAVFGTTRFDHPAQATHGGMDTMALDMDHTGNSSSAIGSLQQCTRINKNGNLDADEDVPDGVFVDVTATNIPSLNDGGTPGSPADDSGGITGYQYTLNYPSSQLTVSAQQYDNAAVNILASNSGSSIQPILSEPVPDDNVNNTWATAAIDIADPITSPPESGSGALERLTIQADPGAVAGQYLLSLTDNGHVDAAAGSYVPHTTNVANIAVGINSLPVCGTLITSYGYYHPVTPARILDTRPSQPGPGPKGKINQNSEITVNVTGVGGVPSTADVSAVVINVTATEPTAGSFLTVYPSGEARPLAANLNFIAGQTVPNLVTVKVGADGNVKVYNAVGQTHVIFDVAGWYGGPTSGSRYNPIPPYRIFDSRPSEPGPGPKGAVGPGAEVTVDVTDTTHVPTTGATAVVVNVTVAQPTAGSFLTVYPSGETRPLAANLNFVAGQTVPNLVIAKIGADGNVKVYNAVGSTHVIFDVVGWYGSSSGDVFNPVTPARVLDTRSSPQGTPAGKVQQGVQVVVDVTGVGLIPTTGASAVIVNTTVAEPTAGSYLTVYPSDVVSPPLAANLNFVAGQTVPNLVIVKVGADGNVKVFNAIGSTHVIFDAAGYFAPVP